MRQLAAAVLAVPVLLPIYALAVLRRPLGRAGLAAAVIGLGVVVWVAALPPARTTADQPVAPTPLPVAAFTEIHVRQALRAPVLLSFSAPMDEASVRSALTVQPAVPVSIAFGTGDTTVTIAPADRWSPETWYTVSVGTSAKDRSGKTLSAPVRTTFLTRPSVSARMAATGLEGGVAPLDARFIVTVEGDVSPTVLATAIRISPAVPGTVSVSGGDEESARGGDQTLQAVFTPAAPLSAGSTYTVSLAGLVDGDGAPLLDPAALVFTTAKAPAVVRFRPLDGATGVQPAAIISVRFTQAMDRASTQAAFSVMAGGKPVAGTFDWAEKGTVLLYKPAKPLDYSQAVGLSVAATARSAHGVPLADAASATFTTIAKPTPPAPKAAPKPAPRPAPRPVPIASGGTVASGTWAAVEAYYLRLLNCTRTGGWVTTSGSCLPGSNGTAPLVMNAGLQTRVARPYARILATTGACSHTAGGTTLASRLRSGGFSGYIWAGENVGCGNGDPYKAMLADHLFFQNEKSTNGGHYRNIMDRRFKWVGVGVWVYGGRCRLVTDFYDP